jgi:hypothetical protein
MRMQPVATIKRPTSILNCHSSAAFRSAPDRHLEEARNLRNTEHAIEHRFARPWNRRGAGMDLSGAAELQRKLQVSFDSYRIAKQGRITRDVEARNVMAVLPGRSARRIYISGHYDTVAIEGGQGAATPGRRGVAISQPADPDAPHDNPAPGVNDDGSGVSLTLELARVFSQSGLDFDATLVFMCHVAEEQGLMGAKLHARKAQEDGIPIEAAFNNDIVGGAVGRNEIGTGLRFASIENPEDSPSRSPVHPALGGGCMPSHVGRCAADRFARGGHSAYMSGSRPSASVSHGKTSRVSTTRAIPSKACRPRTSPRTRESTPLPPRRSPWPRLRLPSSTGAGSR